MNKKDLKRFKTMLEESKRQLLVQAKKTLTEEASFDTDDLPDEIDLASSEYTQSMIFRLRDREKFLLAKIDKALARIENGTFGICEKCEEEISAEAPRGAPGHDALHPLQGGAGAEGEVLRLGGSRPPTPAGRLLRDADRAGPLLAAAAPPARRVGPAPHSSRRRS